MPWFKVDDTFAFHSKVVKAGNAALGLWVRAGSWSAQTLTGGMVPDDIVRALGGTRAAVALCSCGLWSKVDGGYQFHDWDKYQPSKESVEAERESARDRQKRAREKAKSLRDAGVSHGVTNGVTHGDVTPVVTVPPSHPIPTQVKETTLSAKRGRFDEFWTLYPSRGKHSNPKEPARQKWNDIVRTVDPDLIIAAVRVLAKQRDGEDPQVTPQAVTWLKQRRWTDDPVEEPQQAGGFFTPPPAPADMPREMFTAWNRAHVAAWREGRPGPADWRELLQGAS